MIRYNLYKHDFEELQMMNEFLSASVFNVYAHIPNHPL